MLGEFLEENCPDVSVKVVVKSNEDWPDYIDSVSSVYFYLFGIISSKRLLVDNSLSVRT